MKRFIIILCAFVIGKINTEAQSIQRSVIGSAGKVTTGGAYKLSYTVGEVITKKVSAGGLTINQGFQQNKLGGALPITGLEFYAKRLNNTTVQLDWKTLQEINNKGFHIERKKENENSFAPVGFVASNANGGNDYYETAVAEPDVVLADLIAIILDHPQPHPVLVNPPNASAKIVEKIKAEHG